MESRKSPAPPIISWDEFSKIGGNPSLYLTTTTLPMLPARFAATRISIPQNSFPSCQEKFSLLAAMITTPAIPREMDPSFRRFKRSSCSSMWARMAENRGLAPMIIAVSEAGTMLIPM